MSCLHYENNKLFLDHISLETIAAKYGTPCYVYSRQTLEKNWQAFNQALKPLSHRICYAVKANSNIAILQLFANFQSGFDIVSLGELSRVMKAGGDPKKIIFSGVAKSKHEIEEAIAIGIDCFNVESTAELERLNAIASHLNKKINIAFRVNPNVNPNTHAHISTGLRENKFGIDIEKILPLCATLQQFPALNLVGIGAHIGSQITELAPFAESIDRLIALYTQLVNKGFNIKHVDIGGGLGITYHHENPPSIAAYGELVAQKFASIPVEVILEPGRSIVGNAGVLLTRIEYLKPTDHKHFAIVDAGMNDLMRPALYEAWQNMLPVLIKDIKKARYDIAGPVCESTDFLGKGRDLAIEAGDLLAIDGAGAYGFSMASNYNSRTRPAEVLVDQDQTYLIRRRETIEELYAAENLIA